MNVIVFGGSGFLGSHTADALTKECHKVTIFDICKSPYLIKNQKMIVGDILDRKAVEKAVENNDIVYNFAAVSDIDKANKNPLDTIEKNVMGNTYILEACRKKNIKRYIFSSSLYIYNELSSFYGTTKKICELLIENYHNTYELPYTILRYGSLYGPRAQEWNGPRNLLEQAIKEKQIIFNGTGEEVRELIHVKDAANLNVKILEKEYENTHLILTGIEKMKLKDLINMINEMMGGKIKIEYKNKKRHDHYEITPYLFKPQTARKITSTEYHDLGQGLLACMYEICEKHQNEK